MINETISSAVAVMGAVGYWVPLLTFLGLIARFEALKALVSANFELAKLVMQILMFVINLLAFQLRFPLLGAFLMLAEFLLLMYYLWNFDMVSLAVKLFFKSVYNLFAISLFAEASSDADERIKELQTMVNMVLEDNRKMTLELESLRAELAKNSQSIFYQLASMTSGSSFAIEVAVLILLVVLISLVISLIILLACRRSNTARYEAVTQESYRKGSEFFSAKTPKHIVRVFDAESNQPLGHGTFVKHPFLTNQVVLLTAKHVVENADSISVRQGSVSLSFTSISMLDLGHDVVALTLPFSQVQSIFGLNKADFPRLSPEAVTRPTGAAAHADGQSSLGSLKAGNAFGTLAYSGSTLPGFSGTPYFAGSVVYGIHTGSSASTNLGVDGNLILARLRAELKNKGVAEESDDTASYIYDQVKEALATNKNLKWNYYGGDQYEIQIKGKYFVVYADDMAEMGLIERNHSPRVSNPPQKIVMEANAGAALCYDDSENFQRGSVHVQAPGVKATPVVVPPAVSSTSRLSSTSQNPPQASTSPSTSHLQSISAQLDSLSRHMQRLVDLQRNKQREDFAVGNGKNKKFRQNTPKEESACQNQTSKTV